MKQKKQVEDHLNKALDILKRQVLSSDELKVRTFINFAIKALEDASDEDAPKSGAV
jgi:nucleoid DNA-binding protein